jgi:hypothetical protein
MLVRAAGAGALAGAAGVAAMTLGEKLEQAVTGRPDSEVPGRSVLRLAGLADDPPRRQQVNAPVHVGMAIGVGALRGVMAFAGLRGPWASAMFTVVRLTVDQTVENWAGTGAPPWTWPRAELAIDLLHKAVYAFTTGAVADTLAGAMGTPPGERHAHLVPGRVGDVGPVARQRAGR